MDLKDCTMMLNNHTRLMTIGLCLIWAACANEATKDTPVTIPQADAGLLYDGALGPDTQLPANCTDGVLNGDETTIDCGGSCAACPAGDTCAIGSDCQSGHLSLIHI